MGLQEHEFDVAPELLAALARGAAGPLLDAALVHGANVADAAAELRAAEQSERLRDAADSVKGALSAALHGAEAAVRDVGDRGAFDSGRVGDSQVSGPNRLGDAGLGPAGLGPGRGAGRIGIGRHGHIRGSTVHDFLLGLSLGASGDVSQNTGAARTRAQLRQDLAAAEKALEELSRRAREAERRLNEARRSEQNSAPPATATQSEALADAYNQRLSDQARGMGEVDRIRAQLRQRRYDNPEDLAGGSALDTSATAFLLLQRLLSLGGLGERAISTDGTSAFRVPSIMRAVDPSPTDDNSSGWQTSVFGVDLLDLVDPTPEL